MDLDFDARPGRSRRRSLRLVLLAGVVAGGVTTANITLTGGALSAGASQPVGRDGVTGSERQSITIGLPDATSSAAAMRTAALPEQKPEREQSQGRRPSGPMLASLDTEPLELGSDAPGTGPAPADNARPAPEILIPIPEPQEAAQGTDEAETAEPDEAVDQSAPASQAEANTTAASEAAGNSPAPKSDEAEGNWQELTVRSGDSLAGLFRRAGLDGRTVRAVVDAHERAGQLRRIYPGDIIELHLSKDGQFRELRYELSDSETLHVTRNGSSYSGSIVANDLERRVRHKSAVIRSSLFRAGERVGLSDELLLEVAEIFGWDIDFALDIRRGDAFTVIYEAFYRDGEQVRTGKILAAEFVNQGEAFRAVRYANGKQKADYYDPQGHSMRKAFLRTPVDFTRVSSEFNPNRMHPTLGERRAHMGTDYAASPGTPIKATGDGKVVHRGWKGGYGRTVILKHGGRYTTLYAHMSGYRRGLDRGEHVRQGQTIGYVGSSGRSTGPHLHYEFRVNGQHRNPRTVDLPDAKPIPDELRADFEAKTEPRLAQLAIYSRFRLAAQGEFLP